jgi:hypothetical protein
VVREGVGAGGRKDPSLICTYEYKKNNKKNEKCKKKISLVLYFHLCK